MRLGQLVLATLLCSGPSLGQEAGPDTAEAREHFEAGVNHARNDELDAAIRGFEAAYAARPHYSVLYNIALAQSGLGRIVQAVATFERYLAEGGTQLSKARRDEVTALIAANRKRIGAIQIVAAAPERTRIWLDGTPVSLAQLSSALPVVAGTHSVLYSSGSDDPIAEEVSVAGGATAEIRIPAPSPVPRGVGQLEVVCSVPGMLVSIDGTAVATTPVPRPLLASSTAHAVSFSRPGYRATEQTVTVTAERPARVACNAEPAPNLAANLKAQLRVQVSPADARTFVDGSAFTGATLPFGLHALHVERDGYLPYRKTIAVEPGRTHGYDVMLVPTPAKRARDAAALRHRNTVGYALGGTGIACVLLGSGLLLWNQQRYDDWHATPMPDPNQVASIQRVDDVSLGVIIVGSGLVASAAWLLFTKGSHD